MGFTPRSSRLPQPCVVRNPKYERCLTVARSMSFHCQDRADKNFSAWEVEYEGAKGKDPDWPFTRKMVFIATALQWLKGVLPLVGAILLLIGAVVGS